MKSGKYTERRKLSAGTVFMLVLLVVVLTGSALVLGRLSSGARVDLSKLNMNVLDLSSDDTPDKAGSAQGESSASASRPETAAAAAPAPTAAPAGRNEFTLTAGGSISLSGEVRKNSKSTDAKVADYADVMMLLAPRINADVNIVFLENILSDKHKVSDSVAPAQASALLKEAGFGMAACGFSQAYAAGKDGVEETLMNLDSRGVGALGIRYADDPGRPEVRTVGGMRTAFLQYTATVPAKTRKSMEKEETTDMVPEADLDLITQDIDAARKEGAEAVIVLLSWGRTGKDPDKAQRELAEGIAAAGADLIIGNGSHVPQTAEYLTGVNGRSVLCVWSLGTLLDGDRSNIKRMSGYLLHVTIRSDGQGGALILNPEYTPVYTWKYKQDGRYYYRCIATDGSEPDGMDAEQRKAMAKSAETVAAVLKDAPVSAREQSNGP